MRLTKWTCHVTSAILGYICMTVLCKRNVRGDTYGDLGDEIVVDYPTHPTRKNQIPKGMPGRGHKIQTRTIMQNGFDHYVNPLYYREFIPAPHPREIRIPQRINARHFNKINTWRKKDFIHRPLFNKQALSKYIRYPSMYPAQVMGGLYPRTLGVTVNKNYQHPNVLALRNQHRPPASVRSRDNLSKQLLNQLGKVKHHIHVQVVPKVPLNPNKAERLGIHSGFVLLPVQTATLTKGTPKPLLPPPARFVQKVKGDPRISQGIKSISAPLPRIGSGFSERKHIWIPSKQITAQEIPIQEMTSYHVDDIGNLIPDNDPQLVSSDSDDPLLRNLGKVAMRWAGYSPSLRRNINNNPTWLDALEGAMKPKYPDTKPAPVSRLSSSMYQSEKQSPRAIKARNKAVAIRTNPKSSQRILYFAHNVDPVRKLTTPNGRYQPAIVYPKTPERMMKYVSAGRTKPSAVLHTTVANFIKQLGPSRISKQYEIPQVSNKVYRYINEKTVPASISRLNTKNPLLRYLQYHRTHPYNERTPVANVMKTSKQMIVRNRMPNMKAVKRNAMLMHVRARRAVDDTTTSLTSGRDRRATPAQLFAIRRQYYALHHPPPFSALFMPGPAHQSVVKLQAGNRGRVPWNYFHNEITPDGRIRPALYPIAHHIPPGKCLPDGSLCDKGHDEQCCGRSAFCQDYWGISKCVAYSKVTLADMHNPYQIQHNRLYKHFYRYLLSRVELK